MVVLDVPEACVDALPPFVLAADAPVPLDEVLAEAVPGCCARPSFSALALADFVLLALPVGCDCGGDAFVWLAVLLEAPAVLLLLFPLKLWLLLPGKPGIDACCGSGLGAGGTLLPSGLVSPASSKAAKGCALAF